jgi:cathepsin L
MKRKAFRAKALLNQLRFISIPITQKNNEAFHLFTLKHKKIYSNIEEYQKRKEIFEKNLQFIENHNKKKDITFKLGINQFSDLTQEEIQNILMPKPSIKRSEIIKKFPATHSHIISNKILPKYVNWLEKGAVTRVKDQGVCGSCWTFGTTGSIEGAWFIKHGELIELSEQQIVDCAWVTWGGSGGNSGCDGGFAAPAMQFIIDNGGIALEESYPYLMQDHWCNKKDTSSGVKLIGYVNVTQFSEEALMDAVANHGPVAIAIDASHPEFTFYTNGIYYQPNCSYLPDDLDHEVLVVGYGTENGMDYWLVKNSWSTHWGDKGYIKMARNKNNNCGIASQANYPLV